MLFQMTAKEDKNIPKFINKMKKTIEQINSMDTCFKINNKLTNNEQSNNAVTNKKKLSNRISNSAYQKTVLQHVQEM